MFLQAAKGLGDLPGGPGPGVSRLVKAASRRPLTGRPSALLGPACDPLSLNLLEQEK